MIEEPKQDGYYLGRNAQGETVMMRRYGCGWWCMADHGPRMSDTDHFPSHVHSWDIVAIEPVSPPTWERKTN